MLTKRKEIESVISSKLVFWDDFCDSVRALTDIVEIEIEHLKEECPYAVVTIGEMEKLHYQLFSMIGDIENADGDGEE